MRLTNKMYDRIRNTIRRMLASGERTHGELIGSFPERERASAHAVLTRLSVLGEVEFGVLDNHDAQTVRLKARCMAKDTQ
jgi:predicted MarR family transcription regulator